MTRRSDPGEDPVIRAVLDRFVAGDIPVERRRQVPKTAGRKPVHVAGIPQTRGSGRTAEEVRSARHAGVAIGDAQRAVSRAARNLIRAEELGQPTDRLRAVLEAAKAKLEQERNYQR